MTAPEPGLVEPAWRKSTYSAYNGNCVEVAVIAGQLVGVRDTRDQGAGPVLTFEAASWQDFLARVKS
jgi:uncharacterized protein DUF397